MTAIEALTAELRAVRAAMVIAEDALLTGEYGQASAIEEGVQGLFDVAVAKIKHERTYKLNARNALDVLDADWHADQRVIAALKAEKKMWITLFDDHRSSGSTACPKCHRVTGERHKRDCEVKAQRD